MDLSEIKVAWQVRMNLPGILETFQFDPFTSTCSATGR